MTATLIGPSTGAQVTVIGTPALALSGHRVVVPNDSDLLVYADAATLAHLDRPAWLTTQAMAMGVAGRVVAFGRVVEPSWAWAVGQPIFLGLNGALTQVVPVVAAAAFLLPVALAESPTALVFEPQPPIVLS